MWSTDALVAGLDSAALRELAGSPEFGHEANRELFRTAMHELGVTAPDSHTAHRESVRFRAREIVAAPPLRGAERADGRSEDRFWPLDRRSMCSSRPEW